MTALNLSQIVIKPCKRFPSSEKSTTLTLLKFTKARENERTLDVTIAFYTDMLNPNETLQETKWSDCVTRSSFRFC